ncbi:MAG TPA: Rieske 2Fe-2S domain-containing protein [Chloroflexota bacterium]|nr:Rieske 2Fe-2S domain-containing protein [Chloroflexota bacterium]
MGADEGWAPALALAALREREVRLCYVAGHPLALALVEGAVYAVDGRCPHWGATFVDGPLRGDSVRCPLHGFRYDVRSGAATWPEGWPPATTYATRVDDGVVYVQMGWRSRDAAPVRSAGACPRPSGAAARQVW